MRDSEIRMRVRLILGKYKLSKKKRKRLEEDMMNLAIEIEHDEYIQYRDLLTCPFETKDPFRNIAPNGKSGMSYKMEVLRDGGPIPL